jgi:peptide/nickel transport system ATP-binding protein
MSIEAMTNGQEADHASAWQALMKDPDVLLRIAGFRVKFRTERAVVHAINGLDLVIHKGESLGLVGETGAGKTTTAISILNLLPRDVAFIESGSIEFEGRNVQKMSEAELKDMRGSKVSMIFQNPLTAINPVFTVL